MGHIRIRPVSVLTLDTFFARNAGQQRQGQIPGSVVKLRSPPQPEAIWAEKLKLGKQKAEMGTGKLESGKRSGISEVAVYLAPVTHGEEMDDAGGRIEGVDVA